MKKQEGSITIGQDSFEDILAGRTGNLIADEEIPEILRAVIKAGAVGLSFLNSAEFKILFLNIFPSNCMKKFAFKFKSPKATSIGPWQ